MTVYRHKNKAYLLTEPQKDLAEKIKLSLCGVVSTPRITAKLKGTTWQPPKTTK
jgi:hypothetical protein